MDKEDVVYWVGFFLHMYIYTHIYTQWNNTTVIKTEWNFAIFNNMGGLWVTYAKWSKFKRDKYAWYRLYVEYKK